MSFRVHFHSIYDLSVINYCCFLSRSGSCCLLVVSKLLISPCPLISNRALIDFLFSFSIQIACFSLKVSSLVFILVCGCHHRMQDSKYTFCIFFEIYDTFPAFNIWRINATGHSWSFRKSREGTVPILMLTSDRDETLKVLNLLAGKTSMCWITQQ